MIDKESLSPLERYVFEMTVARTAPEIEVLMFALRNDGRLNAAEISLLSERGRTLISRKK